MENVICTVVQEKTAEEFISVLNKYGVCTDYSSDYERSKALQGIFVGVINKVYDVVWKGEGGHSEHDTLFMSAKSLVSNTRESQPFRVGFVGSIVSQLVQANLKEGDAIGILKPKFFYALDIPTLCAGVGNVVVWIAKDLKGSEVNEDSVKSSDENQYFQSLKKQRNSTDCSKKRIPFIDEDSDTHSLGESSTSGTLRQDIQIFRSRPVELNKNSEVSSNNKLVPDSTTRAVAPENALTENLVSQNTANVGSVAEIACRNENQSNLICGLDSAVKSVHKELCCSCHNVANNTCGIHSAITSDKTKCCTSRVDCCNCHARPACKENSCSFNYRPSCACFNNQHCSCTRNRCCGHNTLPQCAHWNSAHSCRTDNSSCNRHCGHHCRPMKSCCGPCHSEINQCCISHCQNGCMKSKCFHRQTNVCKTNSLCYNKQTCASSVHCHNLCSGNPERINISENKRGSHCCAPRHESNSGHLKLVKSNEEMSIELSEDSHKNSRTKEWVHNWVRDPPHLLPDIEVSDNLGTSSQDPSLESRQPIVEGGTANNNQQQSDLVSSNPTEEVPNVSKEKHQKYIAKKKKLYSPQDNSTIISAKSVYCNSTIIEESTPFDSENHTDTPQERGLSSDLNRSPKDKNVCENINLPLSNNSGLNNVQASTFTDPPAAKSDNNNKSFFGEKLCYETNAQGSTNINQLQNKVTVSVENRISSDEQFLELRIDTPIISSESRSDGNGKERFNKTNPCEIMADHVEVFHSKDNTTNEHPEESSSLKMIVEDNNKESSFQKASGLNGRECDGKNVLVTDENHDSNESDHVQIATIINKNNKDSSCNKSLALQDHPKSKACRKSEEMDSGMDFTLMSDKKIDKEGTKRIKECSDDVMELTCESMLIKRRKKDKYRKTRSVGSLSSGKNINDISVSSSDSFYDARSDGILSLRTNKWCLKPIKEVFEKHNFTQSRKVLEGLSLQSGSSYNLNLFSTFTMVGAVINILPSLSSENFGNIVEGFCNEGCRKKYTYEDYKEMEPVNDQCTFCRYNYHLACPGCLKAGAKCPLCLYYNFEIHLFDGENVLRIEIDHKSGVDFLGCTPQYYLHSDTLYKKINKVIFPITQDNWVNPVLLKAKIKVKPKSGASVLTLDGTSLKKDLTFKGKHYKL